MSVHGDSVSFVFSVRWLGFFCFIFWECFPPVLLSSSFLCSSLKLIFPPPFSWPKLQPFIALFAQTVADPLCSFSYPRGHCFFSPLFRVVSFSNQFLSVPLFGFSFPKLSLFLLTMKIVPAFLLLSFPRGLLWKLKRIPPFFVFSSGN